LLRAASYAALGQAEQAEAAKQEALKHFPDFDREPHENSRLE
jgi:hypothetical protein